MDGILLPAYIENITTRKDKTIKITIGTQEVSQGKAGELFSLMNQLAVVYIAQKEITREEIEKVNNTDPEIEGKTPSQRLRSVMFLLFRQDAEGHPSFDAYYRAKMETMINHLKSKITPF